MAQSWFVIARSASRFVAISMILIRYDIASVVTFPRKDITTVTRVGIRIPPPVIPRLDRGIQYRFIIVVRQSPEQSVWDHDSEQPAGGIT
jgi:hypothetical protein